MAHELEIINGAASMFSVRETPWHRLGKVVQEAPTAAEAIKLAGLDWPVELRSLYLADGRKVEANAVVRTTDNAILGHHVGPQFTPLQNAAAFAWFDPFIQSGECSFETAGSLRSGSRVWILAQLNRTPLEVAPGDTVRKFLLLSHSHDGTLAVRIGLTPIRVVCANTLALAHNSELSQMIRIRHTSGMHAALENVREIVNTANAAFEATAEQYRKLANTKIVNRMDLRKYVIKVLKLTEQDNGTLTTRSANTLAAVMENINTGRGNRIPSIIGTWWAAYNGITEYLSYGRGRSEDTRLNAAWFGEGVTMNAAALEMALTMAGGPSAGEVQYTIPA
jgi:phage/plasmid-like protein (TIGR03299 family)